MKAFVFAICCFLPIISACSRHGQTQPDAAASANPSAPSQDGASAPAKQEASGASDAAGYVTLGNDLYQKDRDEEALAAYQKALDFDPDYGEAHLRMGLTYNALGRREDSEKAYEAAVKAYEKMSRKDEKNPDVQLNLAEAYAKVGEYQKAIEAFRRANRLKDPDSYVHYEMGMTYNRLARYQEAVKSFQQALELDPNDFRSQEALDRAKQDHQRQKARVEAEKKKLERQLKGTNANANNANAGEQGNNTNSNSNTY
ncbi:MAG: tetratricopeptide repeat protein [Pyrinomonadaceae bacterium]